MSSPDICHCPALVVVVLVGIAHSFEEGLTVFGIVHLDTGHSSVVALVAVDIAPVIDSRGTSTAPSSTTERSGNRSQPTRGNRARQVKEPKGSTRRREEVEDSELDKAPKRQTKSRKK